MPPYRVVSPVKHDGQLYPVGELVEFEDEVAKPLQLLNVLEPLTEQEARALAELRRETVLEILKPLAEAEKKRESKPAAESKAESKPAEK